jgi:hypothetical protein
MSELKSGRLRWLLALFLVAATVAAAISVPVIAGSGSTKVVKKIVRQNTGLFHSLTGATVPYSLSSSATAGSLSLPSGKYVVNATVNVGTGAPGGNFHECQLKLNGATLDTAVWKAPSGGPSLASTLPLEMAVALKRRGTVTVVCSILDSGTGFATETWITAVRGPTLDGK